MGLDFKEAFSSFLHQYFHTNANFWNSVKIYGNFKVAVDEYQEDYLFSEVITKSDCCCSSNLLDKVTSPISIRGSVQPQAPIIIKEEPNELNRPTIISDVTITNSSNITTPNTNTTPTISTSPSTSCSSSTSTTVVDKTTNCGTDGQPSHVETEKTYTVLSPDPTYTIPPRPSRWYISNCQPQATDIDGRPIIPSLLVSSAPTVPSSPNKITDMLQITSCEGDEEAAALQTFSSAQEHDHIPTEDTVTLQGPTAFTSEAQVADMKIPVGSVGQFVDRGTTKMEPINSVTHFTDHIDISSVGSVVNGVRFVDQIITKKEPISDTEDATSNIHLPHSLQDSPKDKYPKYFPSNLFQSNSPQTILSNAQALNSHLSLSEFKYDPHALLVNPNRQPLNRKTASPSLKVFRKTLNKALRISYQKAMNLGAKSSNFIPTTESALINDQTAETTSPKPNVQSMDHFKNTNKDIILAKSLDLRSSDLTQPLVAPSIIKLPPLSTQKVDSNLKLSQRSAMYPSRHKKTLIQFSPCLSTESNKKIENLLSSHRTLPNAKAVDSIDLTVDNESFVYGTRRNAKYNSKFRCATCGKYFTRKSSLNEHQKDVHDRTNDKFMCCICGKRFTRPQHLRDHMNIHYMCKPHECTSCGHTFFNKISLLRHKRKCYIDKHPDLQLTYASQVEKTLTTITPLTTACPHNSSSNDSTASNNDRPQAGFVNKETADKYSMKELLPGSSIYMYDEQLDGVRKRAYDKKGKIDGRRMARQLMNIFFKKNELINCSISSSPAAGKTQLNPVLVNSIISYCQVNSTTLKSAIKDAMWSKITSANAKFAKKMKIQQIQQQIQR